MIYDEDGEMDIVKDESLSFIETRAVHRAVGHQ
jgi:hypothetical protein